MVEDERADGAVDAGRGPLIGRTEGEVGSHSSVCLVVDDQGRRYRVQRDTLTVLDPPCSEGIESQSCAQFDCGAVDLGLHGGDRRHVGFCAITNIDPTANGMSNDDGVVTALCSNSPVSGSEAAGTPLRLVSLVALDLVYGTLRGDEHAVRHRAVEHAFQTLDAAKEALPKGFPVTATVAEGSTVEEAVKKLDWHDGDLIMVGSSRLAAARRTFLGSTAAKMLRVLDVPMVVVPKAEVAAGQISH
jgi:nucleotide-binding universal stress UspA family protein